MEPKYYLFDDYIEGGKDSTGRTIEKILHYNQHKYCIYFVKDDYLTAHTSRAYEDKEIEYSTLIEKQIASIDALPILNIKSFSFIREGIGSSIYQDFSKNQDVALIILDNLEKRAKKQIKFHENIEYFSSGAGILYIFIFLSLIVFSIKKDFFELSYTINQAHPKSGWEDSAIFLANALNRIFKLKYFLYSMTIAGLGGFLSQIMDINSKEITEPLGRADGVYKMIFSLISGFFLYLVVKSNLLLGFANEKKYVLYVFCFLIGYNKDIFISLSNNISEKYLKKKDTKDDN